VQVLCCGREKGELRDVRPVQEKGRGDGESNSDGGAVREGLSWWRQGARNGDRGESEDEEGYRIREEAWRARGKVEASCGFKRVRRGFPGYWTRRS